MKKEQMNKIVSEELEHIPKKDLQQNILRSQYQMTRMHYLGKKAEKELSALEIITKCILDLKKEFPDYKFTYDETFFSQRH
jgi:hypothetical protein